VNQVATGAEGHPCVCNRMRRQYGLDNVRCYFK
jgi:hypothetical protein